MSIKNLFILFTLTVTIYSQGVFDVNKPDGLYSYPESLIEGTPWKTPEEAVLHNASPFSGGVFEKKDTTFTETNKYFGLRKPGSKSKVRGIKYVYKKGDKFYVPSDGYFTLLHVYDTYSWAHYLDNMPIGTNGGSMLVERVILYDNSTGEGNWLNNSRMRRALESNPALLEQFNDDSDRRDRYIAYIDAFCAGRSDVNIALPSTTNDDSSSPKTTLVLKNGKEYVGTISVETDVYYTILVNGSPITVYKSVVVSIN